jgi:deoxyribodipyrimidine photo-lyase
VVCAADFGPYGRRRDDEVEQALASRGIELERVGSPYAVEPGTVRTKTGTPYRVYSPFYRAWQQHAMSTSPVAAPETMTIVDDVRSDGIPAAPEETAPHLPRAGESAAHDQLRRALERVDGYADDRNFPALDATTRMSPYLKYGCVHPRQILAELGPGKSAEVLRKELAWREFYADVLFREPQSHREALQEHMATMRVDTGKAADERFDAWTEGRTGYPIVDAGMRQLQAEGWMHNRVRMIVASFLVKDLHIDWWRGARHFLANLVDGDLASNNHGWQWVAGTGTDAAPYFRVFNPVLQGEKFDPDGAYVRRYVPELRDVDSRFVHRPWDAPSDLFAASGGYPRPIVDHAQERDEALRRYDEVRR